MLIKGRRLGMVLIAIAVIIMLTACGLRSDDLYIISGRITEGDNGLAQVRIIQEGKSLSIGETDAQGFWSAEVEGETVIRPQKEGYYFEPETMHIQEKNEDLNFLAFKEEDKKVSVRVAVDGLLFGDMHLYKVEIIETMGLSEKSQFSLLDSGVWEGRANDLHETAYHYSFADEIVLALIDGEGSILAITMLPFGEYTETLNLEIDPDLSMDIVFPRESMEPDYLAEAILDFRGYDSEEVPLEIRESQVALLDLPPGYFIMLDVAVEFDYAFDNRGHFNELFGQKLAEVGYDLHALDLYFTLPNCEKMIDGKTGEEVNDIEDILAAISLLYDHENPDGRPLTRAFAIVTVETLEFGPTRVFTVTVEDVHHLNGARRFTILDPEEDSVPFGIEMSRNTLEEYMPLYILPDHEEEEPETFNISGVVETEDGQGLQGVTISFSRSYTPVTTDGDGRWAKNDLEGTVIVYANKTGYSFNPSSRSVSEGSSNVNFLAQPIPTDGFVDDFSGGLGPFWQFTGVLPWEVDSENSTTGGQSVRSGPITHNEFSGLKIIVDVEGPEGMVAFDCKVSSEEFFDSLLFYVDDQVVRTWSGEKDWVRETFALDTGRRVLEWRYRKDGSVSINDDCAWIDNVHITGYPAMVPLHTSVQGQGMILKEPHKDLYYVGEEVQLHGVPDEEWAFVRWQGDMETSTNPINVTVDDTMHLEAVFISIDGNLLTVQLDIEHQWPTSVMDPRWEGDGMEILNQEQREARRTDWEVANQVIVGFEPGYTDVENRAFLAGMDATILDSIPKMNAYLLEVSEETMHNFTQEVLYHGSVRFAEPNYVAEICTTVPNDPHYSSQWHYNQIRLPQAWSVTTGNSNIRVAVLDTGINVNHPDLGDIVDTGSGYNFVDNNRNANDNHGHGTHVAGTIGANTHNSTGVAGIMWQGSIIPIKVLDDGGSGSYWNVAQGMLYAAGLLDDPAISQPVHIMNLSLGGPTSSELIEQVVKDVAAAGVLIVAASGNSFGDVNYPAYYPEVIAVGSVDYNYPNAPQRAPYSSFGPELDLVAPGGNTGRDTDGDGHPDGVLSTALTGSGSYGYAFYQGTSMASPHVAGVAGLMLANGIPVGEVRETLQRTAIDLGAPGFDNHFGYGLVNAYWAVSNVEHIKIVVGTRDGQILHPVAQGTLNVRDRALQVFDIPSGEYQVFAWIDVQGNGRIDPGDYFAASPMMEFQEQGVYLADLLLREED